MRVLVGMSGGVDSSIASWLLREEGHRVEGLSLRLFEAGGRGSAGVCCSREALESAAATACLLGIPHRVVDARALFFERVVSPFVEAYARGLTPNPCVLCNRHVKFPLMLREARRSGADFMATGHYARVRRTGERTELLTGLDTGKDQSYFLYALRAEELRHLVLPLGGRTKREVRALAERAGLPARKRPESQEICFVEEDYDGLIRDLVPEVCRSGPIKDPSGRTVGTHRGIHRYTLGQRRGLGVSAPEPLYVVRIDAAENAVYVGPREATLTRAFGVTELHRLTAWPERFSCGVKVRSTMPRRPARVELLDGEAVRVRLEEPFGTPAPGQAAVFYEGDVVLGGGTVSA